MLRTAGLKTIGVTGVPLARTCHAGDTPNASLGRARLNGHEMDISTAARYSQDKSHRRLKPVLSARRGRCVRQFGTSPAFTLGKLRERFR